MVVVLHIVAATRIRGIIHVIYVCGKEPLAKTLTLTRLQAHQSTHPSCPCPASDVACALPPVNFVS